jgi:MFS family permease
MSAQAAPEERRVRYGVTFMVLAVGVGAYSLLQSFVIPVMSTLEHNLHASASGGSWILTAYLLTASIFTPIVGRIGDVIGKERVFVATLLVLVAGSVLAALATNLTTMIAARAIQGVGGGVLPLAFGIVRDEFPSAKVAGKIGALASLTAVAGGLGTVIAGPIVEVLDYHWLFWLPAILVSLAAVAAKMVIPASPGHNAGTVSWQPAIFLSAWLVCLLLALSQGSTWGWGSPAVLGLLALAAVLCAAWVMVENRVRVPLIDMHMMRRPQVWSANLATLLMGVAMYSAFAFLPSFVQTPSGAGYGFGASITISGLILLPAAVTIFVFGLFAAPFVRRFGAKRVVVYALVVAASSFLWLALWHGQIWQVACAVALYGAGFGVGYAATASLIVDAVPADQTGVASGMNANIRTVGGAIGTALTASIVAAGAAAGGLPLGSGYTHAFVLMTLACVAAAGAGLLIPRMTSHDAARDAQDPPHAELAFVAAGTLVGDQPE